MVNSFGTRAMRVLAGGPGTFSKSAARYPGNGLIPDTLVRGEGAYVWGADGRRYLDLVAALGPILLGHADPRVTEAVTTQLAQGTSFSLVHHLEIEVAEALCDLLPGMEMCRWMKNGSDATNAAIRLARTVTKKQHIICAGYHGANYDWYGITTAQDAGILPYVSLYSHQVPWGTLPTFPPNLFSDLAAIIVEVPSVAWGESSQKVHDTLQMYCEIAHASGAVFILDEVITMLRYGLGGAQQMYGIQADLVTGGKALANGLPLAVLAGKRELMQEFHNGKIFCSYTYAGETTALAAAQAVLTIVQETDALRQVTNTGQALGDGLQALFHRYETPVELLGTPARLALRWQEVPGVATALELRTLWLAELARRGMLWGTGAVFPMTCWTAAETAFVLGAAESACHLIRRGIEGHCVQALLPCDVVQDVLSVR